MLTVRNPIWKTDASVLLILSPILYHKCPYCEGWGPYLPISHGHRECTVLIVVKVCNWGGPGKLITKFICATFFFFLSFCLHTMWRSALSLQSHCLNDHTTFILHSQATLLAFSLDRLLLGALQRGALDDSRRQISFLFFLPLIVGESIVILIIFELQFLEISVRRFPKKVVFRKCLV